MWRETLIYATNKQANNTRYRKTSIVSVLGKTESKAERIKAINSESRGGNEGTTNALQCPVNRDEDSGGRWADCVCWVISLSDQYRNTSQGKRDCPPIFFLRHKKRLLSLPGWKATWGVLCAILGVIPHNQSLLSPLGHVVLLMSAIYTCNPITTRCLWQTILKDFDSRNRNGRYTWTLQVSPPWADSATFLKLCVWHYLPTLWFLCCLCAYECTCAAGRGSPTLVFPVTYGG